MQDDNKNNNTKLEKYTEPKKDIDNYTLMHKDKKVCYLTEKGFKCYLPQLMPFGLEKEKLNLNIFEKWLENRIDHLSRTYMNKVYIARKIGRDREKILRDSCGISITDNYWVKRPDINTTYAELRQNLDKDRVLINTALTGEIKSNPYKSIIDNTTSIFTIKGVYPKAVFNNKLIKSGDNAGYEVAAYKIGKFLRISTAEAALLDKNIVESVLFTNQDISLAHASELLKANDVATLTNYKEGQDDEHRAMHEYFTKINKKDIVNQLERLYLLNYLLSNNDLHSENFGILYESDTKEFIAVAPAFDFNNAFESYGIEQYYEWIVKNLKNFGNNNKDVINKLKSIDFNKLINSLGGISDEQKKHILDKRYYVAKQCSEKNHLVKAPMLVPNQIQKSDDFEF